MAVRKSTPELAALVRTQVKLLLRLHPRRAWDRMSCARQMPVRNDSTQTLQLICFRDDHIMFRRMSVPLKRAIVLLAGGIIGLFAVFPPSARSPC